MKSKLLEKLIKNKIKFGVDVTNDTERDKLLSLFDNYTNIKWVSEDKPKEWLPKDEYPYYIYLNRNKEISFGDKIDEFIEVDYKDLFSSRQEIHITRKDNKVHAILKENDKVIKHTIAKCHPEDEFDFKVGSKLAYDRLFEKNNKNESSKNVEATKPKHEFKVGDKVRIRQWDDMVEEFGENYGIINVGTEVFSYAMKYLCGKIAIIKATGANNHVHLEFKGNVDDTDYWVYTTDMIEPYTPGVAKAGEYVKILETGKIVKCDHDTEYYGEKIFKCNERDFIYLKPEQYEVLDDYTPPLNCRFVVLKDVYSLTKGKIYEIKNGRFKDDEGGYFPYSEPLKDKNDLKDYFSKDENKHRSRVFSWTGVRYIVLKED